MKFREYFIEISVFCCVFFLFLCPVLLNQSQNEIVVLGQKISYFGLCLSLLYLFFYFSYNKTDIKSESFSDKKHKKLTYLIFSGESLLVLGLLLFIQGFFQLIAYFTENLGSGNINFTRNLNGFIFTIINFLSSVICEEFIFRHYLPFFLKKIISRFVKVEKISLLISAVISGILFSLGHRSMGLFAVLNAFFAHFCLLWLYEKTKKLGFNIAVHFIYNLIIFVIAFQMSTGL